MKTISIGQVNEIALLNSQKDNLAAKSTHSKVTFHNNNQSDFAKSNSPEICASLSGSCLVDKKIRVVNG